MTHFLKSLKSIPNKLHDIVSDCQEIEYDDQDVIAKLCAQTDKVIDIQYFRGSTQYFIRCCTNNKDTRIFLRAKYDQLILDKDEDTDVQTRVFFYHNDEGDLIRKITYKFHTDTYHMIYHCDEQLTKKTENTYPEDSQVHLRDIFRIKTIS